MTPTLSKRQRNELAALMLADLRDSGRGQTLGRTAVAQPSLPAGRDAASAIDMLRSRQADREVRHTADTVSELERLLRPDELFRLSYVPFVIAELVWDYADTVVTCAENIGDRRTRPLSRTVRKLRRKYMDIRALHIDEQHRQTEIDNMYIFEQGVRDIIGQFTVNLGCDIRREYPDIDEMALDLLTAAYLCHVVSRALLRYADRQCEKVSESKGIFLGDILPPPIVALDGLILEYVGDKPASDGFRALMDQYIHTLSVQMALIILKDIKEPET